MYKIPIKRIFEYMHPENVKDEDEGMVFKKTHEFKHPMVRTEDYYDNPTVVNCSKCSYDTKGTIYLNSQVEE